MPNLEDAVRLRSDRHQDGRPLTQDEREQLVKPYLPSPLKTNGQAARTAPRDPILHAFSQTQRSPHATKRQGWARPRLRPLIAHFLHIVIFQLIQLVFSVYIHTRRVYHAIVFQCLHILYYHHRSPELIQKDVKDLSRLPQHLSIILDVQADDNDLGDGANWEGLERLVRDVGEICAWCVCAGIPLVSIYERTGILKQHMPYLNDAVKSHLRTYFPSSAEPTVDMHAPHQHPTPRTAEATTATDTPSAKAPQHLNVLLISASDGRDTLVDLTKTLAEMSQRGKLSPSDISTELIDGQVTEASFPEPDLLLVMAPSAYRSLRPLRRQVGRAAVGDGAVAAAAELARSAVPASASGGEVCLRGYPPWQVRLTEIFHVRDSHGVQYQIFLRALCRYAKAEMRFGR